MRLHEERERHECNASHNRAPARARNKKCRSDSGLGDEHDREWRQYDARGECE
jgi:hypothetical protein